jgi:hypothetical protein
MIWRGRSDKRERGTYTSHQVFLKIELARGRAIGFNRLENLSSVTLVSFKMLKIVRPDPNNGKRS